MRSRFLLGSRLVAGIALAAATILPVTAEESRRPLSPGEEVALRALVAAVDAAQLTGSWDPGNRGLAWDIHVLKARNLSGYVPFTVALNGATEAFKSGALYVRAVRRRDGQRGTTEHSVLRDWLINAKGSVPGANEFSALNAADMPIGGPAVRSARRSVSNTAQSSTILSLQEKAAAREMADGQVYAFESYYFFETKGNRTEAPRLVQRALSLPAGEYDVFVALVDRARRDGTPAILSRTVTVPNFQDGDLELGSLMLVNGLRPLTSPLKEKEQIEHPYAFGENEIVPATPRSFTSTDDLSVVFQICNYGAPKSSLMVDYGFYQTVDGARRLFNRTATQELTNADLPASPASDTQTFVMQSMPLASFRPGRYELEVVVLDRVTQLMRKAAIDFVVRE